MPCLSRSFNARMPQLTRRRDPQAHLDSLLICYGDLQVRNIGLLLGASLMSTAGGA
jgi:hypothetical protein